jgi:hypothetical protein
MLASAFFPTDASFRRRVLINRLKFYDADYDKVGVIRHELGHVLGFRHEHIRSGAPAACPTESEANTTPLTDYDPRSLMHYFCGGSGSRSLGFSELDVIGAVQLYGPPLDSFLATNDFSYEVVDDPASDVISFASNIRPLFRNKDRKAMLAFGPFDLWKYEDVVQHSENILREISSGNMPCDKPWSDEMLDTFEAWMQQGMNP